MIMRAACGVGWMACLAWPGWVLAGEVLYEKESPYNTIVVTEDDQGLRTLFFERNGVRQSVVKVGDPDHLELPYARAMLASLAFAEEPRRVLIIGLGGGTIPGFLHKHFPKMVIDVIDIDPDVVDVARKFFGFRDDARLRAHVRDGRRFIEECQNPYDVIFLDAFGADNIPYRLATREFLVAVRRALVAKGMVVGNVWSRGSNPLYDSMVRTYQEVFETLCILDVQNVGNKILIALPRAEQVDRNKVLERARAISQEKALRYDMGEIIQQGYREVLEKDPQSPVLLDSDKAKRAA